MSTNPSEIRAQIETTRANLSDDVDRLAYEAQPSTIAHRQVEKVKAKGSRVLDRILGAAEDVRDSALEKVHRAGDAVSGGVEGVGDTVSNLPQAARYQAQGNPVVAGLVAFGLGLLVAAAIPPSEKEKELAETVKEKSQPLVDQVTEAAKEVAGNLQQPAAEAVESLKESAGEAVENVKAEGSAAVGDVQDQARNSADDVTASARSAAEDVKDEARQAGSGY